MNNHFIPKDDPNPIRREMAIKEERAKCQTQISPLYYQIEAVAYKAQRKKGEMNTIQSELYANSAYDNKFAFLGLEQIVTYSFALLHYPAVYTLNFILIREPMAFLGGNLLAVFIPALLLLVEVGVCAIPTMMSEERDNEDSLDTKRTLKRLSRLLIFVTPGLVIASFLAGLDSWSLTELGSEVIAMVCFLILAVATDVLVVFGYVYHRRAFAFLIYQVTRVRAICRYKYLDNIFNEYVRETHRCYIEYQSIISEFNYRFPDYALAPHPFSESVEEIAKGLSQPHQPPF